jgi:hypothetical protein
MNADADLARGWRLPGDSVPLIWTHHSVERFAERVRPGLAEADVRVQLSRMLSGAVVTARRPDWLDQSAPDASRADAFLLMGEDVCAPLVRHRSGELAAVTVVFRAMQPPRSKQRRRRRRTSPRVARGVRGRPHPGPTEDEWRAD